jgi:hypothetical protein
VWTKTGARRPVILPPKQEIYPSVLSANLKTMGLSFEDLRLWLSRKG